MIPFSPLAELWSRDHLKSIFSPITPQGCIFTLCHAGWFGISVKKYVATFPQIFKTLKYKLLSLLISRSLLSNNSERRKSNRTSRERAQDKNIRIFENFLASDLIFVGKFTPSVFSTTGGMSRECFFFLKKLSENWVKNPIKNTQIQSVL